MKQITGGDIHQIHTASLIRLNGLVKAKFKHIIDALHIDSKKEEIEYLSNLIEEPVLLAMGNELLEIEYVEQLFIPCSDKAKNIFSDSIPENGQWLPPISYRNGEPIVCEDYKAKILFSLAQADEEAMLELLTPIAADRRDVEDRLIAFAEKGLNIYTEWNDGEIFSTEQLLVPTSPQMTCE